MDDFYTADPYKRFCDECKNPFCSTQAETHCANCQKILSIDGWGNSRAVNTLLDNSPA